jgi:hypothetical protein
MTTVTMDNSTGNMVFMQQHQMLVTWFEDATYMGLMVYLFDSTGIGRIFVPLPDMLGLSNNMLRQVIRYGAYFGTILELRRWLEMLGISTQITTYITGLLQMFGR